MTRPRPRTDVPAARTWDPSAIFESPSRWDESYASLEGTLDEMDPPDYAAVATPAALASALEEYDDATRSCGRLWAYARLRSDEDTTDAEAKTRLENARSLLRRLEGFSNALERRIRTFEEEALLEAPELEGYRHYLRDAVRRGRYAFDGETQRAVDRLRPVLEAPDGAFQTFVNGDFEAPTVERPGGEAVTVTPNHLDRLLRRRDREFRRTVHEAYHGAFEVAHDLLAESFATRVDRNVRVADLRGYDSARQAALDREPANDVGQAVPVNAHVEMLASVRDGLDAYHRYYEAKRDHLGVASLRPWDRYVALVDGDGPEIPYDRATDVVIDAVAPLGEDYQSRLRSYLEDRRVDVHETPEKSSEGLAYTLGVYGTDPYVLTNYEGDLRSVFVLAHELGHAMHHLYANETQPRIYAGFNQAVSELPSNLHEVLVARHLADADDADVRRHATDTALRRFEDMFFRHALLAAFTQDAHDHAAAGNPLTPAWLDETYADLLGEFQAPLDRDDAVGGTWVGDNQAHRPYGSYPYVMGRAGAHAIADGLESGDLDPSAYRSFLQAGASAYPTALLDAVDVDLTAAEPYERAISAFDEGLGRLT